MQLTRTHLLDILRVGIFYDGSYFYKVSNYYKYEHKRKSRISISGLHEFIRNSIACKVGIPQDQCKIIDAHYFRGRSPASEMEKVQSERNFEDILMRENIVTHYLPLHYGENKTFHEKGIDVWLALEAYDLALSKNFDFVVLVTGDGDYVPLVRKLHAIGALVVLVSWDFSYLTEKGDVAETKTSEQLSKEAHVALLMSTLIDENPGKYVDGLFVKPEEGFDTAPVSSFLNVEKPLTGKAKAQESKPQEDETQKEHRSTIFSIKENNGYGFIRDDVNNNVFFLYSVLTNREFADIKTGMRVSYLREEDMERSKRDGAPRYNATRVTVLD